jgi:hypothetical protein
MPKETEEKRTTRVQRRRRGARADEKPRAEAPQRRRPTSPAASPSSTSGAPPVTGTGIPAMGSPKSLLGIVALLVFACISVIFYVFLAPDSGIDDGFSQTEIDEPYSSELLALPTRAPEKPEVAATSPPLSGSVAESGEGDTWLIMLYQDADDKILEQDIYVDLNEAERVGSNTKVHIVAQVDRYQGGFRGDGDWTSTKRFYLSADPDLHRIRSQEVADLGEANMADGDTLVDFVTWAVASYPADKHVLILSDHGMGWPGGWTDPAPGGRGDHDIALAQMGDQLFLMELDAALQDIRAQTGIDKFELIGLDACLMGHIEVFSALAPHARYAVASQEVEPALGWAYTSFLTTLAQNPNINGAELGRRIVESYIREDQRIVDEAERADFAAQGASLGGLLGGLFGPPSAQQLVQQMEQNITLAAVNLEAVPGIIDRLNDLAFVLQRADKKTMAQARTYAQSFTSIFGDVVPPSYIDLGNLAQLAKQKIPDAQIGRTADALLAALGQAIVAETHGTNKPGASGISIYFPNSKLYGTRAGGAQSYTTVARRFAMDSLWDEFLSYLYVGRPFDRGQAQVAVPAPGETVKGPGAGQISVSPVTASADVVAPGESILLRVDIEGENVGYVYLFAGFLDRESNSVFVADTDYLESPDSREVDGVTYPDWGEGAFTMEFEWEPIVFAINDGTNSEMALFSPEAYGAAPKEAVYTVEGIYTYADGGDTRYAKLYFSDGALDHVYGTTGEGDVGAPREIIPQAGDTFTILRRWIDLGPSGSVSLEEGEMIKFSNQPVTWEELYAPAGEYVVGFIIEDLDGNRYPTYTEVTVR